MKNKLQWLLDHIIPSRWLARRAAAWGSMSTKDRMISNTKWRLITLSVSAGGSGIALLGFQISLLEGHWAFAIFQFIIAIINFSMFIYATKSLRNYLMPIIGIAAAACDLLDSDKIKPEVKKEEPATDAKNS